MKILRKLFLPLLALLGATLGSQAVQARTIYHAALAGDWKNYSWGCNTNFSSTAYMYNGTNSIEVTYTGAWQGFVLHHNPFNSSPYTNLTFWINGGTVSGRTIQVNPVLNGVTQQGVNLNKYIDGGSVVARQWKQVNIPLSALGLDNKSNVTGFMLEENAGTSQAPFYLNDISLVEAPSPSVVSINVDTTKIIRTVDSRMFGLNVVNWDGALNTPDTISLLNATPVKVLRFPGGSDSDQYHWQTNTIKNATDTWTSASDFDTFANLAKSLGTQAYITVNYGSGTASEAANWVNYSNKIKGYGFKYWEIGNEIFGDWEYDTHAVPHDPYTYATQAASYFSSMKAVDPSIKIGVVVSPGEDSFIKNQNHSATNPRTGQVHYGWTPVVLSTLRSLGVTPDFLIYHRYDQDPGSEDDFGLLQSPETWANDAADLRQQLTDYLGSTGAGVELIATEYNSVGSNPGKQTTSLVNGLFFADSLGQALKTEFNGMMFWNLRNRSKDVLYSGNLSSSLYGWRNYGDYGMMSYANDLYPTYYVFKLLKNFATGGDSVVTVNSNYFMLSSYAIKHQDGSLSVLVVNKSPSSYFNATISLTGYTPATSAAVYSYGIVEDNAAQAGSGFKDVALANISNASASLFYNFPPYSVTLFKYSPSAK